MLFSSKRSKKLLLLGALATTALTFGVGRYAIGSDHGDTVVAVKKPGIDFSDLHIFPGADANNVVLSMSVRPLIPAGQATPDKFSFDTDVLYQFKIDTTGDNVEDLVIQAKFEGKGANQRVRIAGPVKPSRIGTITAFETPDRVVGTFNKAFTTSKNMRVFAGFRGDPFFLDFEQLSNILPDRASALDPSKAVPASEANTPKANSFRAPGQAKDFFANFNVLSIVVELPRTQLGGGKIGVWQTASVVR